MEQLNNKQDCRWTAITSVARLIIRTMCHFSRVLLVRLLFHTALRDCQWTQEGNQWYQTCFKHNYRELMSKEFTCHFNMQLWKRTHWTLSDVTIASLTGNKNRTLLKNFNNNFNVCIGLWHGTFIMSHIGELPLFQLYIADRSHFWINDHDHKNIKLSQIQFRGSQRPNHHNISDTACLLAAPFDHNTPSHRRQTWSAKQQIITTTLCYKIVACLLFVKILHNMNISKNKTLWGAFAEQESNNTANNGSRRTDRKPTNLQHFTICLIN